MVISDWEMKQLIEEILDMDYKGCSQSYRRVKRHAIKMKLIKNGVTTPTMEFDDVVSALEKGSDDRIVKEHAVYYLNKVV